MNLIQRAILSLGFITLLFLWVHPPVYKLEHGVRLESSHYYAWELPIDWSVDTTRLTLRIASMALGVALLVLVFSPAKKEGGK